MKLRIPVLTALLVMAATVLAFADVAASPVFEILYYLPIILVVLTIALICIVVVKAIKRRRRK